jgi:hypothetical protein
MHRSMRPIGRVVRYKDNRSLSTPTSAIHSAHKNAVIGRSSLCDLILLSVRTRHTSEGAGTRAQVAGRIVSRAATLQLTGRALQQPLSAAFVVSVKKLKRPCCVRRGALVGLQSLPSPYDTSAHARHHVGGGSAELSLFTPATATQWELTSHPSSSGFLDMRGHSTCRSGPSGSRATKSRRPYIRTTFERVSDVHEFRRSSVACD